MPASEAILSQFQAMCLLVSAVNSSALSLGFDLVTPDTLKSTAAFDLLSKITSKRAKRDLEKAMIYVAQSNEIPQDGLGGLITKLAHALTVPMVVTGNVLATVAFPKTETRVIEEMSDHERLCDVVAACEWALTRSKEVASVEELRQCLDEFSREHSRRVVRTRDAILDGAIKCQADACVFALDELMSTVEAAMSALQEAWKSTFEVDKDTRVLDASKLKEVSFRSDVDLSVEFDVKSSEQGGRYWAEVCAFLSSFCDTINFFARFAAFAKAYRAALNHGNALVHFSPHGGRTSFVNLSDSVSLSVAQASMVITTAPQDSELSVSLLNQTRKHILHSACVLAVQDIVRRQSALKVAMSLENSLENSKSALKEQWEAAQQVKKDVTDYISDTLEDGSDKWKHPFGVYAQKALMSSINSSNVRDADQIKFEDGIDKDDVKATMKSAFMSSESARFASDYSSDKFECYATDLVTKLTKDCSGNGIEYLTGLKEELMEEQAVIVQATKAAKKNEKEAKLDRDQREKANEEVEKTPATATAYQVARNYLAYHGVSVKENNSGEFSIDASGETVHDMASKLLAKLDMSGNDTNYGLKNADFQEYASRREDSERDDDFLKAAWPSTDDEGESTTSIANLGIDTVEKLFVFAIIHKLRLDKNQQRNAYEEEILELCKQKEDILPAQWKLGFDYLSRRRVQYFAIKIQIQEAVETGLLDVHSLVQDVDAVWRKYLDVVDQVRQTLCDRERYLLGRLRTVEFEHKNSTDRTQEARQEFECAKVVYDQDKQIIKDLKRYHC